MLNKLRAIDYKSSAGSHLLGQCQVDLSSPCSLASPGRLLGRGESGLTLPTLHSVAWQAGSSVAWELLLDADTWS
jgi:hypothetical protein